MEAKTDDKGRFEFSKVEHNNFSDQIHRGYSGPYSSAPVVKQVTEALQGIIDQVKPGEIAQGGNWWGLNSEQKTKVLDELGAVGMDTLKQEWLANLKAEQEAGRAVKGTPPEPTYDQWGKPIPTKEGVAKNIPQAPISKMTADEFVSQVTKYPQTAQDVADYLEVDKETVEQMVKDFRDYGRVNSMSDVEVDRFHKNMINRIEEGIINWEDVIGGVPGQVEEYMGSPEDMAYVRINKELKGIKAAQTRTEKILAIDKIMSISHARGGKMLSYGYGGGGDVSRTDNFIGRSLDWLRDQTKYQAKNIPTPKVDWDKILYTDYKGEKVDNWYDTFKTPQEVVEHIKTTPVESNIDEDLNPEIDTSQSDGLWLSPDGKFVNTRGHDMLEVPSFEGWVRLNIYKHEMDASTYGPLTDKQAEIVENLGNMIHRQFPGDYKFVSGLTPTGGKEYSSTALTPKGMVSDLKRLALTNKTGYEFTTAKNIPEPKGKP